MAGHRALLLDERHVPPGARAEAAGVVHRHAEQLEPVVGHQVPLLAGHLAGLAADADGGVGEEPHARRVGDVARLAGHVVQGTGQPVLVDVVTHDPPPPSAPSAPSAPRAPPAPPAPSRPSSASCASSRCALPAPGPTVATRVPVSTVMPARTR